MDKNFFKKILTVGAMTVSSVATRAEGLKTPDKDSSVTKKANENVFSDSTIKTKAELPLAPGENYREIIVDKEIAGIKVESILLIPTDDTTKDVYLVEFSGKDKNMIDKEIRALEAMGLKPASSEYLEKVNMPAFKKVGQSIKIIDKIYQEAENLGQGKKHISVNVNDVIDIRNPIKVQSTEIKAMTELGSTSDYATLAYKEKTVANFADGLVKNK